MLLTKQKEKVIAHAVGSKRPLKCAIVLRSNSVQQVSLAERLARGARQLRWPRNKLK